MYVCMPSRHFNCRELTVLNVPVGLKWRRNNCLRLAAQFTFNHHSNEILLEQFKKQSIQMYSKFRTWPWRLVHVQTVHRNSDHIILYIFSVILKYFKCCSIKQIPWVPEGLFLFYFATTVSGEPAIVNKKLSGTQGIKQTANSFLNTIWTLQTHFRRFLLFSYTFYVYQRL